MVCLSNQNSASNLKTSSSRKDHIQTHRFQIARLTSLIVCTKTPAVAKKDRNLSIAPVWRLSAPSSQMSKRPSFIISRTSRFKVLAQLKSLRGWAIEEPWTTHMIGQTSWFSIPRASPRISLTLKLVKNTSNQRLAEDHAAITTNPGRTCIWKHTNLEKEKKARSKSKRERPGLTPVKRTLKSWQIRSWLKVKWRAFKRSSKSWTVMAMVWSLHTESTLQRWIPAFSRF